MAPVIPNPRRVRSFRSEVAFETWIKSNYARETELWIKFFKKASGITSITYPQALDVALCWGWIDGLRKSFDDKAFLQRFTPRRPKSVWSQINRGHVARLTKAGRMTPQGQRQIDAAKADGRWAAAYAPIRMASIRAIPTDLMIAIKTNPRALRTFRTLGGMNLFDLAYRTSRMRTAAGRERKVAELVAMLARGESIVPERGRAGALSSSV